ncbi:MAG: EamA family transporter [Patescibacteria group bacterium]|nr:EamA family transporter [Patescibacteria group bacterium]
MSALRFVLLAVLFYAIQNVILERRLAQISPAVIVLFSGVQLAVMAGLVIVFREQFGMKELVWPSGWKVAILLGTAALLFLADFCYVSAYNAGGRVALVTTCVTLVPVAASLINAATGGGWPSLRQWLGCTLAVAAVILVKK